MRSKSVISTVLTRSLFSANGKTKYTSILERRSTTETINITYSKVEIDLEIYYLKKLLEEASPFPFTGD